MPAQRDADHFLLLPPAYMRYTPQMRKRAKRARRSSRWRRLRARVSPLPERRAPLPPRRATRNAHGTETTCCFPTMSRRFQQTGETGVGLLSDIVYRWPSGRTPGKGASEASPAPHNFLPAVHQPFLHCPGAHIAPNTPAVVTVASIPRRSRPPLPQPVSYVRPGLSRCWIPFSGSGNTIPVM